MKEIKNNQTAIEAILFEIDSDIRNNLSHFKDASVESGYLGIAIFYFFMYETYHKKEFFDMAEEMIEQSINSIIKQSGLSKFTPKYRGDTLSNLFSSFGKGLLFIDKRFNYCYDFTSFYEQISETLEEILKPSLKNNDYDFFSGALAQGHFFLNYHIHSKSDSSTNVLKKIVSGLHHSAISQGEDQMYWRAPAYDNRVYLGISHGSAMIVNFLTKLFKNNILTSNSHDLRILENAVNFLMEQKRTFKDGYFPNFFPDIDVKNVPTQLSMCYGDLGILLSLYEVSFVLNDTLLRAEIEIMLKHTISRSFNPKYTLDGGIIFGCSGVYFIIQRLSKYIGHIIPEEVSNYWLRQILMSKDPYQDTISKFKFALEKYKDQNTAPKYSFGWGIAGIGCSLLSSLNPSLPPLDELLIIGT
ncbi:lanthionine synthetase LanC family protein [Flavobacterium sp. JP2137]|uniref:lanthionine synthetase LanC family protein n=1 Tax=Flavobacterium sp. JP2137 TaxID=3414510 RepID=UPI003D300A06